MGSPIRKCRTTLVEVFGLGRLLAPGGRGGTARCQSNVRCCKRPLQVGTLHARLKLAAPFPLQVQFEADIKPQAFKAAADALEEAVKGSRAVRSACRDARRRVVTLFWKENVGYKGAYSWIKLASSDEGPKWQLDSFVSGTPTPQRTPIPVIAAASGARSSAGGPSADMSPCPAALLEKVAADLATPRGQVAVVDAALGGAFRPGSEGSAIGPLQGWLVVKALEARRVSTCPKAGAQDAVETSSDVLGEGSFAQVRKGTQNGVEVALKTLKHTDQAEFLQEVAILSRLSHPNIVRLLDVIVKPRLALVLKFAGVENLADALAAGTCTKAAWRATGKQLFEGLRYLHSQFVVHGDLKPKNICWDSGRITIVDFGCSVVCLPGFRSFREVDIVRKDGCINYITLPYRAVEVLLGDTAWGTPSDMWSAGVILAALWGVSPLFRADSPKVMLMMIWETLGTPPLEQTHYFSELPFFSKQLPQMPPKAVGLCLAFRRLFEVAAHRKDDGKCRIGLLRPA